MARKAVESGGKKDEIIYTAMKLFFQNGYETTSVRMILDEVGGEIGMFYHYFKSKDELFEKVVDRFFLDYQTKFEQLIVNVESVDQFVNQFIDSYHLGMEQFHKLSPSLHWTIQYAMAGKTIEALIPCVQRSIEKLGTNRKIPYDILAGQLLYTVSTTIHAKSFEMMNIKDQRSILRESVLLVWQC